MNNLSHDPTLLSAASTFAYRDRLVTRIECQAVERGDCTRQVGCVALVDVSRMGTAAQVEDLKRGICQTAIEASGATAVSLQVSIQPQPDALQAIPLPVAGE